LLAESGETMKAAGLTAIDTVLESTAILVKSRNNTKSDLVSLIASRIRGVISMFFSLNMISSSH
jgi:ATP phosphoribosyltransferase